MTSIRRCPHCDKKYVDSLCERCPWCESRANYFVPKWMKAKDAPPLANRNHQSLEVHGKPSDFRPAGSEICYLCNGRGGADRRACSKCRGLGYISSGSASASSAIALPHTQVPRYEVINTVSANLEVEPWFKRTPPPPRLCIACAGKKTAKCKRCGGSGVDPWALPAAVENEARNLFLRGWRPLETIEGQLFLLGRTPKKKSVSREIWKILHQLCVEKRLEQEVLEIATASKKAAKPITKKR